MKNQLKQINKIYNKRLKGLTNEGLPYFVEYLRRLRDSLIITARDMSELKNNSKVTTIITTIREFEAYQSSKEASQKKFHWNNFCEFIKLNMEEWLVP